MAGVVFFQPIDLLNSLFIDMSYVNPFSFCLALLYHTLAFGHTKLFLRKSEKGPIKNIKLAYLEALGKYLGGKTTWKMLKHTKEMS